MARKTKEPKEPKEATRAFSYRSREVRALFGPDTFFPCDHPLVGVDVPGKRSGGVVSGCATPSKKHPRELQLWVGLPHVGKPVRLRAVRDRLRGKTIIRETKTERENRRFATQEAIERYRLDGVPYPVGRVFPGRPGSSKCDPEHPLWSDYAELVTDAEADAAQEFDDPENVSERDYREAVRRRLKAHDPERFERVDQVTRGCVETYEKSFPRSRGYESPQAEVARRRAAFLRAGGDTGSGDWSDQLADSTKAKKRTSSKRRAKR